MKSYQNHLVTTKSHGSVQDVNYRPTMRSSAVFPLIHKPGRVTSIYTFLGYWLRKRNIPLVTILVTVRTADGAKLSVNSIEVSSVKSYTISSVDLITEKNKDFIGSIELEIFSAVDMVFPYPAITFGLKGINGLTFVHTCGRIYNDFDDLKSNNEQSVAQTGFDLYIGKDYKPFFSFVNGPIAIENKEVELEYINTKNEKLIKKQKISDVKPYGLGWIELKCNEENFVTEEFSKCCVKIRHSFEGFFPRFVAGNVLRDFEDVSLTHSYYDTSTDQTKGATWINPSVETFLDGVVAIPFDKAFSIIELAIYPNFSYSPVDLTFELYTSKGELIETSQSILKVATDDDNLRYINFFEVFSEYKNSLSGGMVRVVCNGEGVTPTRMKFGLNFGRPLNETHLPSNICFNTSVPNDKIVDKLETFKWCSIFDAENQKVFLHNTSFVKDGFRDAKIEIEVYREKDDEKLLWSVDVQYNGTVEILNPKVTELVDFLGSEIGWIALTCSSPFITGYSITDFNRGVVGADHLF